MPQTKNKYKKNISKVLLRVLSVFMILGMNWMGISAIGTTVAFYGDEEKASNNTFISGALDFVLTAHPFDTVEASLNMGPNVSTERKIDIVPESNSNPFQYYASSTSFVGDLVFCSSLNVVAKLDNFIMYAGSLRGLQTSTTTSLNQWSFEISTDTQYTNKTCDFDIDFNGWQTRHNYTSFENGGYNDTEKVHSSVSSGGLVINKVYYDVISDGSRGEEGANEWIEIYNQTGQSVDISSWRLCDNLFCNTVPTSTEIPGNGFAVISSATSTWDYWKVPSEIVKIGIPPNQFFDQCHILLVSYLIAHHHLQI